MNTLNQELPPLVLIAGGKSERMKTMKGLLPFHGRFWLEAQLETLKKNGVPEVCVVLGYSYEKYLNSLKFLKVDSTVLYQGMPVTTLINQAPAFGPFSTIQTGLSFLLNKKSPFYSFLAVDTPCPSEAVFQTVFEKIQEKQAEIAFPVHAGKDGHPVFLSEKFAQKIVSLNAENMTMKLLRSTLSSSECLTVEQAEDIIGLNLNTPQEWQAFLKTTSL